MKNELTETLRDQMRDAIVNALPAQEKEIDVYDIASNICDALGFDGKEADKKLPLSVLPLAVNCHEEIIERLKSMSGAYHMHHAGKPTDSQYWFDNCGDGVCTENRLAIAKAEGK